MEGFGERKKAVMNCADFQKVLPYIIDGGANAEQEAHLATCQKCSDLVQDLRYIAEQAKLLVPMHEPSPRVWDNIERSLESGRASSPSRIEPRPESAKHHTASIWRGLGWAAGIAVLVLLTFTLLRPNLRNSQRIVDNAVAQPAVVAQPSQDVDNDDLQVLATLSPDMRKTYESGLKQVNLSIADAKKSLAANPEDETARALLAEAYQQKAMMYELAMAMDAQ